MVEEDICAIPSIIPMPYRMPLNPLACHSEGVLLTWFGLHSWIGAVLLAYSYKTVIVLFFCFHLQHYSVGKVLFVFSLRKSVYDEGETQNRGCFMLQAV